MYKDMVNILKEGTIGEYSLQKYEISIKNNFRAVLRGSIPEGTYIRLVRGGNCLMSDTPMEKNTNYSFCQNAHGDVLIGGLGIGLIILAIQDKPEVNSITVLEKSPEVIQLVASQLPVNSKVNIIQADVFTWKPPKGQRYHTIYMDIWDYINIDVYKKGMLPLIRKYCHYLVPKDQDPKRFLDCWAKKQAKTNSGLV